MVKIPVVDEEDNFLRNVEREEVDKLKLRYRVSALWIKNSKNQVLLAKRALTKKHDPGKWGPAVAGTVEENEEYEINIVKEAREELGLINIKMEKGPKIKNDGAHHYFTQWFIATLDKPISYFKIDKKEVMEIKWFDKSQLEKETKENPEQFLKSVPECLRLF